MDPKTRFSTIVVYRNEEGNLPELLESLAMLNYPKDLFEVILVNDHSDDRSVEICRDFQKNHTEIRIHLLDATDSRTPKKEAIFKAVNYSNFEYLAITDADCVIPEQWLTNFDQEIQNKASVLIAGPVGFKSMLPKESVEQFEAIDFMSLQGTTMGSFGLEKAFMCNSANLCYDKKAFLEMRKQRNDNAIASGDDVFLLQYLRKNEQKVSFLKSEKSIVETNFQSSWSGLFNQRVRWAAKTSDYPDRFGKFVAISVFLMNFSILTLVILSIFRLISWQFTIAVFFSKFLVDLFLLVQTAEFFRIKNLLKNYWWSSIIYPIFSVGVAVRSIFGGYEWKGRRFKK